MAECHTKGKLATRWNMKYLLKDKNRQGNRLTGRVPEHEIGWIQKKKASSNTNTH